jgi:hypothetical protein
MSKSVNSEVIAKLEIIKELAAEKSVQQLCDVLVIFIKNSDPKQQFGFSSPKEDKNDS